MSVKQVVKNIIQDVRERGDGALLDYALKFDQIKIKDVKVSEVDIKKSRVAVSRKLLVSLKTAQKNIIKFNKNILVGREKSIETVKGIRCWREFRPIEKVGLYIPGGRANYPSTVLMLGVLAKLAGCREVVLCSPAPISAVTLAAADLVGIKNIFQIGGAQAIAAMAYGTETVPKVYKIFGPGNKYVTEAKMQVNHDVAIDMPAGPSEIAILADKTADSGFVIADLESQLEHGPDSVAWLVTTSRKLASMVKIGKVKLVKNMDEGIKLINELAPEHLEIIVERESEVLSKIANAGSVFLGNYSPVPAGDYATGPNHTLPTAGWARTYSALSVLDFGKMLEVQKVSKIGLKKISEAITTIADAERLPKHAESIKIRFKV